MEGGKGLARPSPKPNFKNPNSCKLPPPCGKAAFRKKLPLFCSNTVNRSASIGGFGRHDIEGSIAHSAALEAAGLLTAEERGRIVAGLREIGAEIESGAFRFKTELEDIHMNIESELTRRIGDAGAGSFHTARSRNDQVALDIRLYLRSECDSIAALLRDFQRALVDLAAREREVIIPGYTHLQRAQPVYFAHHLLAYVEMIERDLGRVADARKRLNVLPLGSGAIAGSTIPLDRELVARLLDFPAVSQNSMDAVSDRDFAVELLAALALVAMHLSRLSEDVILWASSEFQFIAISDAYTTGSSLMPQKKNPDVAELTRGKTWARLWKPGFAPHDPERAAHDLQSGHAGGQRAGLR